jgi:hypothetical protein
VPAKDFWEVCVYDPKTRSILDTGRRLKYVMGSTSNPDI